MESRSAKLLLHPESHESGYLRPVKIVEQTEGVWPEICNGCRSAR